MDYFALLLIHYLNCANCLSPGNVCKKKLLNVPTEALCGIKRHQESSCSQQLDYQVLQQNEAQGNSHLLHRGVCLNKKSRLINLDFYLLNKYIHYSPQIVYFVWTLCMFICLPSVFTFKKQVIPVQ